MRNLDVPINKQTRRIHDNGKDILHMRIASKNSRANNLMTIPRRMMTTCSCSTKTINIWILQIIGTKYNCRALPTTL
jgi:hypothetical protein